MVAVRAEKRAQAAEAREHARDQFEQRAQASRVTVYKSREGNWPVVRVHNASDQTIFGVRIYGMLPDGDDTMTVVESREYARVPAGDNAALTFFKSSKVDVPFTPERQALVVVTFRDANDVLWLRSESGRLRPVPRDPDAGRRIVLKYLDEQWTPEARATYARMRAKGMLT